MLRKVVVGWLLLLWLMLIGFELSRGVGLAEQATPEWEAVRAVLASFGQAVGVSDDRQTAITPLVSRRLQVFNPSFGVSSQRFWEETKSLKKDFKVYKFFCAFLI